MKIYWINNPNYRGIVPIKKKTTERLYSEQYIKFSNYNALDTSIKVRQGTNWKATLQYNKVRQKKYLILRKDTSLKTSSILIPPKTSHYANNYVNFTKKIFYKHKIELKFHNSLFIGS